MTNPANRGACDKRCAGYAFSLAEKTDRGGKTQERPERSAACSSALDSRTLGFACAPPLIEKEKRLAAPAFASDSPWLVRCPQRRWRAIAMPVGRSVVAGVPRTVWRRSTRLQASRLAQYPADVEDTVVASSSRIR
jgi:hypothetical protein